MATGTTPDKQQNGDVVMLAIMSALSDIHRDDVQDVLNFTRKLADTRKLLTAMFLEQEIRSELFWLHPDDVEDVKKFVRNLAKKRGLETDRK